MTHVKITILGSGTCVPFLERSASSILVEIEDKKLVFDMGVGTMRRLLEKGLLYLRYHTLKPLPAYHRKPLSRRTAPARHAT